jgi:hypothetical protein
MGLITYSYYSRLRFNSKIQRNTLTIDKIMWEGKELDYVETIGWQDNPRKSSESPQISPRLRSGETNGNGNRNGKKEVVNFSPLIMNQHIEEVSFLMVHL